MSGRLSESETQQLFARHKETGRRRDRNALVEAHVGFARHVAKRFSKGGVGDEDINQIALLGLVKAVDRFDPENGTPFMAYAGRTIEGEIKRYFRDSTWAVKVPRSKKELHLQVRRASDELSISLGRSPTVTEVARHMDVEPDAVVEALGAGAAMSTASIDSSASDEGTQDQSRSARLGFDDELLESAPDRVLIERLLSQLPTRERRIVELTFYDSKSQADVAAEVGVSQAQVSRLLRRSFTLMKQLAGDNPSEI